MSGEDQPGLIAAGDGTRGVDSDELLPLVNTYDVGIHVLPPTVTNNALALPNKFFDYVQARLAVIVGPSPEMAEYVERFGVGAVTRDFSAAALAELVDSLDAAAVDRMKAASNMHARELSSEAQVLVWKRAIDALAQRTTAS